jgi:hypothetical protein
MTAGADTVSRQEERRIKPGSMMGFLSYSSLIG